jgi:hypothetical protein
MEKVNGCECFLKALYTVIYWLLNYSKLSGFTPDNRFTAMEIHHRSLMCTTQKCIIMDMIVILFMVMYPE